jgi:RNA polymerase sigma-70 factor, ECF subfamily
MAVPVNDDPPAAAASPNAGAVFSRPQSDAQCIAEVLNGNRQRFAELVERYQDAVFATVRGVVRDPHLAEDVAQDAFVLAFTQLPTLRDPLTFHAWLLQIARHRAVQASIRAGKRPDQGALSGAEMLLNKESGTEERITGVLASVEQLPEPYRGTVLLKYQQGLSCKEIAEKEQVAVSTVTSRLTRGLAMLRTALTER